MEDTKRAVCKRCVQSMIFCCKDKLRDLKSIWLLKETGIHAMTEGMKTVMRFKIIFYSKRTRWLKTADIYGTMERRL